MVEVQRRRVPGLLELVVRLPVGRGSAGRRRRRAAAAVAVVVPSEQVTEHQTGQQAGHAHRAARYHFRFGRQHDGHRHVAAAVVWWRWWRTANSGRRSGSRRTAWRSRRSRIWSRRPTTTPPPRLAGMAAAARAHVACVTHRSAGTLVARPLTIVTGLRWCLPRENGDSTTTTMRATRRSFRIADDARATLRRTSCDNAGYDKHRCSGARRPGGTMSQVHRMEVALIYVDNIVNFQNGNTSIYTYDRV